MLSYIVFSNQSDQVNNSYRSFPWWRHLCQTINCNCLLCTVWIITAVELGICVIVSKVYLKIRWHTPATDLHFYMWRKQFEDALICCLFSTISTIPISFQVLDCEGFYSPVFHLLCTAHSTCTTQDHRPHAAIMKPALCLDFSLLLWTWDHCFFSYNSHLQYSSHYFHTHFLPQLLFQHSWERTGGNTRVNLIFKLALKCIINLQFRGCWYFAYTLDRTVMKELFTWYHWQLHPWCNRRNSNNKKLTVNNSGCSKTLN